MVIDERPKCDIDWQKEGLTQYASDLLSRLYRKKYCATVPTLQTLSRSSVPQVAAKDIPQRKWYGNMVILLAIESTVGNQKC
jgi:hypothetical protein